MLKLRADYIVVLTRMTTGFNNLFAIRCILITTLDEMLLFSISMTTSTLFSEFYAKRGTNKTFSYS